MSEPGEDSSPLSTVLTFFLANKAASLFLFIGILLLLSAVFFLKSDSPKSPSVVIEQLEEDIANKSNTLIKVDVQGAVNKPGVVELIKGARIEEAIEKAEGYSEKVDLDLVAKNVNLAAKLIDGQKIYIPVQSETPKTFLVENLENNSLVNVNNANLSELDDLPGVGKVTAQKIIDGRPYERVEQLLEKKIVGKNVFEKIKDLISLY